MTQHLDRSALDQVQLCFGNNLRMVTRAVTQHFDEALRPSGLRVTQFSILAGLAAVEARTSDALGMTEFADAMMLDRTTLARNLKPLERDGLLETEGGKDRRVRRVRLTEQGHHKLAEAYPLWRKAQEQLLHPFGLNAWRQLRAYLHEIADLTQ